MLQKIVSEIHNLEGNGSNIKMGLRDFLVRIERGCANCATAVSNDTLGLP
jgi:hypothetical protein